MFEFEDTGFEGLKIVRPFWQSDARGSFLKFFHAPTFQRAGLVAQFAESFATISAAGVLRGMHFQAPPHDQAKLVYCVSGRVLDVVLDIRSNSVTYGQTFSVTLDGDNIRGIYISRGFAHGFFTITDSSTLHYMVETVHAPSHDLGIVWDSFGFDWPEADPNCSPRDKTLPKWSEFETPF
jgi:dTDP-4-dehydrorhamnose 3,5-epimerase